MSGSKVFCQVSGKFGPDSKIFGPYCPRAVRFFTDLSQPPLKKSSRRILLRILFGDTRDQMDHIDK